MTATQIITVDDDVPPVLATAPIDITVECIGEIPQMVDLFWTDNCDGSGSVVGVDGQLIGSACGGTITRIWYYEDACGNPINASQIITVDDNAPPTLTCPSDLTIECGTVGYVAQIDSWISTATVIDNCDQSVIISTNWNGVDIPIISCGSVSGLVVEFTTVDVCGNITSCNANVYMDDTDAPIITVSAVDLSVECNGYGNLAEYQVWLDLHAGAFATDNCSVVAWSYDETYTSGCGNTGSYYVVFIATDDCGDFSTTDATFTITDTQAPIAVSQDITIELDLNGEFQIVVSEIESGSSDICGNIVDMWVDNYYFDCGDVGVNTVLLTVEDECGITASISAQVMVEDNLTPTALCKDIDVSLDVNGSAVILASGVDDGSNDNCDFELAIDISTFDCTNTGVNQVNLMITDLSGNTDNCQADVTVIDDISPEIICPDDINSTICGLDTVLLITVPIITDACGFTLSENYGLTDNGDGTYTGTFQIGITDIVWIVVDASQNVSFCVQTVTLISTMSTGILSNTPICAGDVLELAGLPYEVECEANCDLPVGYCPSGSSLAFYQYIDLFELGYDASQSSLFSGYADYTSNSFKTLYIDSIYTFGVHITNVYNLTHYTHVFVDWNRDGDFEDIDETQTLGVATGTAQMTGVLTVPSGAILGKTLLRIVNDADQLSNPCGAYAKGETEDYLVEIKDLDHSMISTYNWSGPIGWSSTDQYNEIVTTSGNSGMYYLTITNVNGCSAIAQFDAIVSDPQISFDSNQIYTMSPETLILDPGVFDTYTWSTGAGSQTISITDYGTYEVTVTENGCTDVDNVFVSEVQDITLDLGWSIWSTYINNINSIDDVMSDVVNDIIIVKDGSGNVYWPVNYGLNTIGNLVIGEAYLTKMSGSQILYVYGTHVDPTAYPITLPQNFSHLGYLRKTESAISDVFVTILNYLTLVKDDQGAIFWPVFSVNQIGNMIPGEGYKVNMAYSTALTYGSNAVICSKLDVYNEKPVYYDVPKVSGSDMTIGIPFDAWINSPQSGDEIAVFDVNGSIVGAAVFTGDHVAMSIWGKDAQSSFKNGMSNQEEFRLELYSRNTGIVTTINIVEWIDGDGTYLENSIAIVGKIGHVLDIDILSITNYPNPFIDFTTIEFTLPQEGEVRISLYDALGKKISVIIEEEYLEGKHQIQFDGSDIVHGNYYIKLEAGDEVISMPIQINE